VLALAVMSTAFTGLAIGTGFERRYGALKRLGASPLPRGALLASKGLAVLTVEALQVALLVVVAQLLGWAPRGSWVAVAVLLLAGTAAFSALGLLMAGTLRAEGTLAVANGAYLLLLVLGGMAYPLAKLPGALETVAKALPAAALSETVRAVLTPGKAFPTGELVVLLLWAVAAPLAAARWFRWEE